LTNAADVLVWREKFSDWRRARDLSELETLAFRSFDRCFVHMHNPVFARNEGVVFACEDVWPARAKTVSGADA
jgi:hypothetical protein